MASRANLMPKRKTKRRKKKRKRRRRRRKRRKCTTEVKPKSRNEILCSETQAKS